MQTFLPYSDFSHTAKSLDYRRLGKQRVETYQILKVLLGQGRVLKNGSLAWQNHPAVKMWRGYESALAEYGRVICVEWKSRGYKDTVTEKIVALIAPSTSTLPHWLGNDEIHRSHQSNLIRKLPMHYVVQFPNVPDSLPYIWPVT